MMEYTNTTIFLRVFSNQYDLDDNFRFKQLEEINFDRGQFKHEIDCLTSDIEADLVSLAIESKFALTEEDLPPRRLGVDELVMYTDAHIRPKLLKEYNYASFEVEDIKETFRRIPIDILSQDAIQEVFKLDELNSLPFEIKTMYYRDFGKPVYTNEDILYAIKKIVWNRWFPESWDKELMSQILEKADGELVHYDKNDGWMDMSEMVVRLKPHFNDADLFVLDSVYADGFVDSLKHYRNDLTLGFKRQK